MDQWTPPAVTRMLLRLGTFGVIVYMLVVGSVTMGDLIAIAGMLTSLGSSLVPDGDHI